tara:strand:+ start:2181 stop:2663 length:483 start_codon:yes stop_codon:yes gene_type:complete
MIQEFVQQKSDVWMHGLTMPICLILLLFISQSSCSSENLDKGIVDSQKNKLSEFSDGFENRIDTIQVMLDEYSIGLPGILQEGKTVFRLESRGFEEHNLRFVINESDSVIWETDRRMSPYEIRTVTFDIIPGEYTVVCDFSGHEARGMFTDLVVEGIPVS